MKTIRIIKLEVNLFVFRIKKISKYVKMYFEWWRFVGEKVRSDFNKPPTTGQENLTTIPDERNYIKLKSKLIKSIRAWEEQSDGYDRPDPHTMLTEYDHERDSLSRDLVIANKELGRKCQDQEQQKTVNDMNWKELKAFASSLDEKQLQKKVILWREGEAINDINVMILEEDHYEGENDEGCYPLSEAGIDLEEAEEKGLERVYEKDTPILWEKF